MAKATGGTRAERRALTAQRILDAARVEFAAHGFDKATIRAIAARAGVDPALVMQHHGSKAALFRSAVRLDDASSEQAAEHLHAVIESRIAGLPPQLHALVRSMLTVSDAAAVMKAYLDDRVENLARTTSGPDAEAQAAVAVCAVLGLTIGRHFLDLDVFDDVPHKDIARVAEDLLAVRTADPRR